MRSFIVGRTQTVHYCGSVSRCAVMRSGVAQGSVLGPLLYVVFTADIERLVISLGFGVHLFADHTQFHGSCKPVDAADLAARALDVINSVKTWMSPNRLRLNADKTQFIWLGTSHFIGRRDMQAVSSILQSSDVVNNIGVYLDSGLVMDRQVSKLCMSSLLLSPASVANSASIDHQEILFGSHSYILDRLQSVLNSAARLVLDNPKLSHISSAIRDELHWLPIRRKITFKIALMVRHCLVGAAPKYLMELCHPVGSAVGWQSLVGFSWWSRCSEVSASDIRPSGLCCLRPPNLELFSAQDQTIAWQFIAFQTETESASVSAVLSASVDPYLIKGLISLSFLYYYYHYLRLALDGPTA